MWLTWMRELGVFVVWAVVVKAVVADESLWHFLQVIVAVEPAVHEGEAVPWQLEVAQTPLEKPTPGIISFSPLACAKSELVVVVGTT
jgi:hypothetical protein